MPRPKKKNNVYFGPEVEEAINNFNLETIKYRKDKIFNTEIYPALNKLTENVINTWKFWKTGIAYVDLKSDLITFLYERLHLISNERGKAYSFLTVCAKRYCIKKSQDSYKEIIRQGDLLDIDDERDILSELELSSYKEYLKDFIVEWSEWCMNHLDDLFKSKNDKKVADAILTLFQNSNEIELYNKKELYILIREHSKLDTQYITRVIQVLKDLFYTMFNQYRKDGKIISDLYL